MIRTKPVTNFVSLEDAEREMKPAPQAPSRWEPVVQPSTAETYQPAYKRGLSPLTGAELLTRKFPPRETILSPWLPRQGLAMIHGPRGLGKTHVGLNVAYVAACGGSFLNWEARSPCRVIYIDGEMPAALLKSRFTAIVAQSTVSHLTPIIFDWSPAT